MGTLSAAVLKVDGAFVCRERGAQQPGKGREEKALIYYRAAAAVKPQRSDLSHETFYLHRVYFVLF